MRCQEISVSCYNRYRVHEQTNQPITHGNAYTRTQLHRPGSKLSKRLLPDGIPKAWSKPINQVDQAAYHHDLCYAQHKDATARNSICDQAMLASLNTIPNSTTRERLNYSIVGPIIGTKVRFGLGVKKKCSLDR